jgi:hypothetical protein
MAEEKDFLEMSAVKFVTVPVYDELAIKTLWPLMQEYPHFMHYFPDRYPRGRLPDRAYFFNVMNTVEHDYLQRLIKHANEMRNGAADERAEHCQIKISDAWWEKLNAMPFISSKYAPAPNARYRVQRPHALAPEVRVQAGAAGAQAAQDPPDGDTGADPRALGGEQVGRGPGLGDDDDAPREALALPDAACEPGEADL